MLRDRIIQELANKSVQKWLIHETSRKGKTSQEIVAEYKTAEQE